MSNICWDCEHNTSKMKILVPHSQTIKECVHRTCTFMSNLIALDKVKQGQYYVWFRSEGNIKLIAFDLLHLCSLKIDRAEDEAICTCFKRNEEKNFIKNIIYSVSDSVKPTIIPDVCH